MRDEADDEFLSAPADTPRAKDLLFVVTISWRRNSSGKKRPLASPDKKKEKPRDAKVTAGGGGTLLLTSPQLPP